VASASGTWAITPSPNITGVSSDLTAVSCVTADMCVAVGQSGDSVPYETFGEMWDGTKWTRSHTVNRAGESNGLSGVTCLASDDCTTVGGSVQVVNGIATARTLIEHWDGSRWSIVASPRSPTGGFLHSVTCTSPTMCVAVGFTNIVSQTRGGHALVESWNGSKWSIVASPNRRVTELDSVSCWSASSCVAVGEQIVGDGYFATLADVWDGSRWSATTTLNPGSESFLGAVSCTGPTSCIAIGHDYGPANSGPLIETWDGTAWTLTAGVPQTSGGDYAYGLSCADSTDCVAVGTAVPDSGSYGTLILTLQGTAWTVTPSPDKGAGNNDLAGVACPSPTTCVAVGVSSRHHLAHTLVLTETP
jgi:hypothetical protein